MGRTKNSPQKRDLLYSTAMGDYIPFCIKKKSKRQSEGKVVYHKIIPVEEHQKQFYLGKIRIGATGNMLPEDINKSCKVTFKNDNGNFIVLKCNDECTVVKTDGDMDFLQDFIQTKVFSFQIYAQGEDVYFQIYLISVPLPKFTSKVGRCIKIAFNNFYGIRHTEDTNTEGSSKFKRLSNSELDSVYEQLFRRRNANEYTPSDTDKNLKLLKPQLRPYQKQALDWMIYREMTTDESKDILNPLYQKITLKSTKELYLDKYTGWLESDPPLVQNWCKGGILGDEMGLGKTIEFLALILSHRCNISHRCNVGSDYNVKSEESDSENENQNKVAKRRRDVEEEEEEVLPVKKSRVSESSTRKSALFQALESVYNRSLSEYCTTKKRLVKPKKIEAQCICGNSKTLGCVKCVDCAKLQHASCMGWTRELGPYKCPQCWEQMKPINSKATLIVTPTTIRKQWCREIDTHLRKGLKVFNYKGYNATPVYPTKLKKYDIVITTYNILQAEMRLTETSQKLNLRRQRKYWPPTSPLVRVLWWRICLDEAQTVEVPGSIVSVMAKKIPALHRWAVTGTPMAKGVSDIFGLIDYLQIEPYNDLNTWKHILYDPYVKGNTEPMMQFLSNVLWRTSKHSILDQINIPQQTQQLHLLEFSAVEKFFYNREHKICAKNFLQIASKFDSNMTLERMDRSDLKNLMAPLLSLRQACSNPSMVTGKGRSITLKKNESSMKDLLDGLILKNKNDCEEALRLMVSAINGLAGIYLLMQLPQQAIIEYRKVLQLAAKFSKEEKEGKLVIDKLPMIHAMHNLAEVFEVHPPEERTLRDDTLLEDCAKLERQYIEKFMKETASARISCQTITSTVLQHKTGFQLKYGQWYSDAFDWVSQNYYEQDLASRVEAAAANANIECDLRVEDPRTLLMKAYNWHVELDELRDILCEAIDSIYYEDPESKNIVIVEGLVEKAMDCHLRPQVTKGKKKKCAVCIANVYLKDYEVKLFTMKKRAEMFEDMGLVGSWKPKFEEIVLKSLLNLLKSKNLKPALIKDGETHISLIEALKKEFKEIRKVWTLLDQQVCAQDELDICKVRLQLKSKEDKKKTDRILKNLCYEQQMLHENIHLMQIEELPHQELLLRSEETRQNSRLEALLGTRNYLGTLRQQQFEGYTPDLCPICRGQLVNMWAILSCAHTYCMECFQALVKKMTNSLSLNQSTYLLQCCVCRAKHSLQDVAYIKNTHGTTQDNNPTAAQNEENELPAVLGDYSRKVESVIQLLLKLKKEDPLVKVLIFSTWQPVLKLLKKALERNNINVELIEANNLLEKRIEHFKDPIKRITALLLPIRLGSKGLNLIEATHVVLLEPLLNPADELQAVGRIHRIGQTKPTFVHKFLVQNTVEESLHNATSSNAAGWEKNKITVGQLKSLFNDPLVEENEETEAGNIESQINEESAMGIDDGSDEEDGSSGISDDEC